MKFRIVPVTAFEQNCSIIWCTKSLQGAIIDPGGDIATIIRILRKQRITINCVLLTHGHIDHVGGAFELSKQLNVPIIGPHRADAYWLNLLPEEAVLFDLPELKKLIPDQWLKNNDLITIGDVQLRVIHCPGHTPGHVAFFHKESKTAFVGDIIFKNSVGRTDFEGGNEQQLMHSIFHKLFPLGDDVTFISGHGPKSTFGREKRKNPFLLEALLSS